MGQVASASVRALGTTAVAAVTDVEALPAARSILVRGLRALDLACSRFRPDSELTALNRSAGADAVPVGELLWACLAAAVGVARATDGLVDPTVGRAMRLNGYDRTFSRILVRDGSLVPATFAPAGRWRELELDRDARTARVPHGVELDLGASAKALAADRIALEISAATGAGVLVSIGGDVAVQGSSPDEGWVVGIDDDHATPVELTRERIVLGSGGLASSGTRVRHWRTAAGDLHHIVDPLTGRPASTPWSTATVAAASCVDANAASTAAIVLGTAAPAWLAERRLPSRLARPDGSVVRVAGWPSEQAAA